MTRPFVRVLTAALAFFLLCAAGFADDWTAVRLRGPVFVYHDGWVKLERGDVVSDDSIIRTLERGRVSFERGAETIDLMPDSQIRIVDKAGGHRFTTVMSDYGKVAIEAEVQNVQHFAVATPFLAAVVKGTKFTVSSTGTGSEVEVQRGHVFVEASATHETTTISQGQTATATAATIVTPGVTVTGTPVVTALVVTGKPPVDPSEPSPKHRDEPKGHGQHDDPPGSGHHDDPPGGGHHDDPPGGGHHDDPPGGGHHDDPPGGGQHDDPPSGGHHDVPPGGGHQDQPTEGGHHDDPPGGGHHDD